MPVVMRGNYIFVNPGEKMLKVASNFTNYLELGLKGVTAYYLEVRIEGGQVLINAVLLSPEGRHLCEIEDSFPSGAHGVVYESLGNGYRFLSSASELLRIEDPTGSGVYLLRGKIYDEGGVVVAEDKGDDYVIYRGPAILGRAGAARGIVMDPPHPESGGIETE